MIVDLTADRMQDVGELLWGKVQTVFALLIVFSWKVENGNNKVISARAIFYILDGTLDTLCIQLKMLENICKGKSLKKNIAKGCPTDKPPPMVSLVFQKGSSGHFNLFLSTVFFGIFS